jgi:hypothetical protein
MATGLGCLIRLEAKFELIEHVGSAGRRALPEK